MKRWTIRRQLSALIAAICLIAVIGQVVFTQLSFRKGFASYVEELNRPRLESIADRLAGHYDDTLGWELVANDRRLWGDIAINPRGSAAGSGRPGTTDDTPQSSRPMGGPAPHIQPFEEFATSAPPGGGQSRGVLPEDTRQVPLAPQPLEELSSSGPFSRGILPPGELPEGLRQGPPPRGQDLLMTSAGPELTLLDAEKNFVVGSQRILTEAETLYFPIQVNEEIVGYLLSPGGMRIANDLDDAFSQKLIQQSAWIGIVVAVLAVMGAVVIAKQFSRPVVRLNEGTDRLMQGDYDYEIVADGPLEFGLLEQKFNRLAHTLAANRASQQHWIANISHELRTPLAILQAELDAMNAGIRNLGPAELKSLIEESKRLGRLIDDLFMLSRADSGDLSYQFSTVDMSGFIRDLAEEFHEKVRQAELKLEVSLPSKKVILTGDADRLRQLFGNLVNNSCAYTDPGGVVCIRLVSDRDRTYVEIEDSAPGVPEGEREKIFDRLYRAEKSRNRAKGGSGLGLAICSAIAEAHGARIEALNSEMGGLRIRVSF